MSTHATCFEPILPFAFEAKMRFPNACAQEQALRGTHGKPFWKPRGLGQVPARNVRGIVWETARVGSKRFGSCAAWVKPIPRGVLNSLAASRGRRRRAPGALQGAPGALQGLKGGVVEPSAGFTPRPSDAQPRARPYCPTLRQA